MLIVSQAEIVAELDCPTKFRKLSTRIGWGQVA